MTQEDKDYCDLKTVLKLKSLGMNVYTSFKGIDVIKNISAYEVLKWLRKNHNIYIVVFIDDDTDKPVTFEIYKGTEYIMREHSYYSLAEWNKAEMDAIEYVLDNDVI